MEMMKHHSFSGALKPFKDNKGTIHESDRYLSPQPLMFGDKCYNMRKLNQLPYHLIHCSHTERLKQQVLLNLEFLLTKIKATSVQ